MTRPFPWRRRLPPSAAIGPRQSAAAGAIVIDFDAVGRALLEDSFSGWVSVELYDHDAVHRRAVEDSRRFLLEHLPSLRGLDRAGVRR